MEKNKPFPQELPIKNGAIAELLRPSRNTLLIVTPDCNPSIEHTINRGQMSCGMVHNDGAIMLRWEFDNGVNSPIFYDTPYDARIVPDLELLDVTSSTMRLLITVFLVDSSTGILRAIRSVTVSHEFTLTFLASLDSGENQYNAWESLTDEQYEARLKMHIMGLK